VTIEASGFAVVSVHDVAITVVGIKSFSVSFLMRGLTARAACPDSIIVRGRIGLTY
jgi:hypothetical protein